MTYNPDVCPSCDKAGYAEIKVRKDAESETWRAEQQRWLARQFFVYRAFDVDGNLLYIGMTKMPLERWQAHKRDSGWAQYAARFRLVGPFNRPEAVEIERRLIRTEHPLWNVQGRAAASRPDVASYVAQRQATERAS